MSLHPHNTGNVSPEADLLQALGDLESQTATDSSRRGNNRISLNCAARLLPGNVSDRSVKPNVDGTCRDISTGGCRVVLKSSLIVGDLYLMQLATSAGIDPVFARCVRCHMIREDAFECGLEFLNPVALPFENDADSLLDL